MAVLFKLRNAGNTLVIIEHQLDVIKCADYVIDLGPKAGRGAAKLWLKARLNLLPNNLRVTRAVFCDTF